MTELNKKEKCEHELEFVDDSFDHEFGTEKITYMQCTICGATRDEDPEIPEVQDYFGSYGEDDYEGN